VKTRNPTTITARMSRRKKATPPSMRSAYPAADRP
jgi:hypothetical protein